MNEPPVPFGQGYAPVNPYYAPPPAQQIIDNEHLRLLRIGYFISAGQTAIFVPFGLFYAAMGLVFERLPAGGGSAPTPALMPLFFGIFGGAIAAFAGCAAVLKLVTAMRLKERRSRTLCLITAGITCFEIPYGTALGLMTFTVLGRASVRQLFARSG